MSAIPGEGFNRTCRAVLIGGSGQVGTLLARHFSEEGNEVTVIARRTIAAPWQAQVWDGVNLGNWVKALNGADVVINLAGRSVDCHCTEKNKAEILESRVRTTQLVGEAIRSVSAPPAVWLNASTATIYRHAMDRSMDEESGELGGREAGVPEVWRFSIEVARRWEQAFFDADTPHTRKIALRSAMTMSPDHGGVFETLLRPGAIWPWRTFCYGRAVRLEDSRAGLCTSCGISDCESEHRWRSECLLPESDNQRGLHEKPSRRLGNESRLTVNGVDA